MAVHQWDTSTRENRSRHLDYRSGSSGAPRPRRNPNGAFLLLPFRIIRGIRSIGVKKRHLDFFLAWALQKSLIYSPSVGIDFLGLTCPIGVLPFDRVDLERFPQGGGILRRLTCPISLNRFPEIIGEPLCVGIPILHN